MPSNELTEWFAFMMVEPIGEERADMRAALIASTLANINRKKTRTPYQIKDFLFDFERRPRGSEPSKREVYNQMNQINAVFGAMARKRTQDGDNRESSRRDKLDD